MKKYIAILVFVLMATTGMALADEIVLEDGKVFSGNVLGLTMETVTILVGGKQVIIERDDVQAVFLGEQTPFSSNGYPGLKPGMQDNVQGDTKDKKNPKK